VSKYLTGRKLKFIGCEIIHREACFLAARSSAQVDLEFLRKGLHDLDSSDMREKVQATIDAIDPKEGYQAVLIGYARCNDGLVGVKARGIPLVIPRAHDCITFFFGSRRAYREYFDAHPGTYYATTGWLERNFSLTMGEQGELDEYARPAYGKQGVMGKLGLTDTYEQMVEKYGQENADFMKSLLGDWMSNYNKFLYLRMGVCDEERFIEATRRDAAERGWEFEERPGDLSLLARLFEGPWDEDFVVVPPAGQIAARNDEGVLESQPPTEQAPSA
jgi:hypothetical protein